jgi:hypothetical protein
VCRLALACRFETPPPPRAPSLPVSQSVLFVPHMYVRCGVVWCVGGVVPWWHPPPTCSLRLPGILCEKLLTYLRGSWRSERDRASASTRTNWPDVETRGHARGHKYGFYSRCGLRTHPKARCPEASKRAGVGVAVPERCSTSPGDLVSQVKSSRPSLVLERRFLRHVYSFPKGPPRSLRLRTSGHHAHAHTGKSECQCAPLPLPARTPTPPRNTAHRMRS